MTATGPHDVRSVNVKEHGATGDGATSDQAAILAAVARVPTKGTLFFPAGTYNLHNVFIQRDDISFVGEGGATVQSTRTVDEEVIAFRVQGSNITVRGLRFKDQNPVGSRDRGVHTQNGELLRIEGVQGTATVNSYATVEDCFFDGGFSGACTIFFQQKAIIRHNRIENPLGNAINVADCNGDVLVTGNYCRNISDDGIAVVGDAGNAVDGAAQRVTITDNIVIDSDAKGITTTGANMAVIANNHIQNTYTFGIGVFEDSFYGLGASSNVIVEGNTIEDAGQCYGAERLHDTISTVPNAIRANGTNVKVRGNIIKNTAGRGVDSTGATHLEVTGNSILETGDVAISLGNVDDNTYALLTDVLVQGNYLQAVAGGIVLGSIAGLTVSGNVIRSYKNGGAGSRRGIFYAYIKKATINNNVVINDDSGDDAILQYSGRACPDTTVINNSSLDGTDLTSDATGSIVLNGIKIFTGTGSPEGVFSAPKGSLYLRTDGYAGTSVYFKQLFGGGNTGWWAPPFLGSFDTTGMTSAQIDTQWTTTHGGAPVSRSLLHDDTNHLLLVRGDNGKWNKVTVTQIA